MAFTVLHICIISVLFGAAMSIMPENGSRYIVQILCTAVLIICILEPIKDLDFETYALESARLHEIEEEFMNNSKESENKLNRLIIEARYNEYILDKAKAAGLEISSAVVDTRNDESGIWVPYSVEITADLEEREKKALQDILTADLGIPKERQIWIYA